MEKSTAAANEKVSNHIPDDLAFSILSKLPLKSLKRFGCVRKSWALLFENPHFMSMYRNNFISINHSYYDNTSLLLLLTEPDGSAYVLFSLSGERFDNRVKLDLPPAYQEYDNRWCSILGSSINGILCLHRGDTDVVLWNPATEEFKVIPPSPAESVPYQHVSALLHGFGYDHVRDDCKLIRRLTFYPDNFELDVPLEDISYHDPLWEIYSLRSNSWRKLDVDMPTCHFPLNEGVRVYVDGVCHWWGESEPHKDEAYLVSFDLSNEVFFTTPIPLDIPLDIDDCFDFGRVRRHLIVLNGSIALISNYAKTTTFHISILGALGVKESWTKLFIVGPLPCVEYPIGAGTKGDIFFGKKDDELAWFDLCTQTIEELGVKGDRCFCKIVIYKESLLSIGGINN